MMVDTRGFKDGNHNRVDDFEIWMDYWITG